MSHQEERAKLNKSLSPAGVLSLAIGSIIGVGCFILPGNFMIKSGPIGAAIAIFLGAIVMYVIAKSYGYMVEKVPVSGGEFAYSYNGFGRYHAFICGWFLTLGYLTIVPLNGTALAIIFKFVAPTLFAKGHLYSVAGSDIYMGEILLATAGIAIFGFLNYKGSKGVGNVQVYMVGLLVISVGIIAGGTFTAESSHIANMFPAFNPEVPKISGILSVMAVAPFLFVGFDTIPQAAEEYDFPPAKANLLIVSSILIGAAIYIAVLLSTAVVFPWQQLVAEKHNWYTGFAVETAIGRTGLLFVTAAIAMGICTGINGFYMATSRLFFSMARAKVLPRWFTVIDEKSGVPKNAVLFTACLSLIAPWFGRTVLIWIVDMCALGTAFGYMYTCFAAYKETRKPDGANVQIPLNSTVALLGGLFSAGILLLLTVPGSPGFMSRESWVACIVWVAMGAVFYFLQAKEYAALTDEELDYLILDKKPAASAMDKAA